MVLALDIYIFDYGYFISLHEDMETLSHITHAEVMPSLWEIIY